jgi:hypothetical protein
MAVHGLAVEGVSYEPIDGPALSCVSRLTTSTPTSGAEWTLVRASWFAQNFSEGYLLESLLAGEVALPAGGDRAGNLGSPSHVSRFPAWTLCARRARRLRLRFA